MYVVSPTNVEDMATAVVKPQFKAIDSWCIISKFAVLATHTEAQSLCDTLMRASTNAKYFQLFSGMKLKVFPNFSFFDLLVDVKNLHRQAKYLQLTSITSATVPGHVSHALGSRGPSTTPSLMERQLIGGTPRWAKDSHLISIQSQGEGGQECHIQT